MIQIGGDYQHFEGTIYIAVVRAKDAVTQEPVVVYTKGDGQYLVCSIAMFEEEVLWPDGETRPRFILMPDSTKSARS
jgi:hypothetical protein